MLNLMMGCILNKFQVFRMMKNRDDVFAFFFNKTTLIKKKNERIRGHTKSKSTKGGIPLQEWIPTIQNQAHRMVVGK